jgi:hypothetical protein
LLSITFEGTLPSLPLAVTCSNVTYRKIIATRLSTNFVDKITPQIEMLMKLLQVPNRKTEEESIKIFYLRRTKNVTKNQFWKPI